jgi:TM2 domain-containing membrane protein YozV
MPAGTTFRQAIHFYLNQQGMDWSKFGIDLLLSSPTDAVMQPGESHFLPENLLKSLDSIQPKQAVYSNRNTLAPFETQVASSLWFTPMKAMVALALFSLLLGWIGKQAPRFYLLAVGWNNLLWFSVGILGCIFVFMWLATDHAMCRNNYNLLWAWPTHVLWPFLRHRNLRWVHAYRLAYVACLGITLVGWSWWAQQMSPALIPLLLLLGWMSMENRRTHPTQSFI